MERQRKPYIKAPQLSDLLHYGCHIFNVNTIYNLVNTIYNHFATIYNHLQFTTIVERKLQRKPYIKAPQLSDLLHYGCHIFNVPCPDEMNLVWKPLQHREHQLPGGAGITKNKQRRL